MKFTQSKRPRKMIWELTGRNDLVQPVSLTHQEVLDIHNSSVASTDSKSSCESVKSSLAKRNVLMCCLVFDLGGAKGKGDIPPSQLRTFF